MSASDIVSVAIRLEAPIVSRAGFKTPMFLSGEALAIFAAETYTKSYRKPSELLTDGFSPLGATYRAAALWLGQVPSAGRFKVGKRTTSAGYNAEATFTLDAGVEGDTFWIEINGTRYEYTVGSADD
jgi:hypothetical protein